MLSFLTRSIYPSVRGKLKPHSEGKMAGNTSTEGFHCKRFSAKILFLICCAKYAVCIILREIHEMAGIIDKFIDHVSAIDLLHIQRIETLSSSPSSMKPWWIFDSRKHKTKLAFGSLYFLWVIYKLIGVLQTIMCLPISDAFS